jgi:hypothetical protein
MRRRYRPSRNPLRFSGPEEGLFRFRRKDRTVAARNAGQAQRVDLFRTLAVEGSRSLQAALLATKNLRFNLWSESIE